MKADENNNFLPLRHKDTRSLRKKFLVTSRTHSEYDALNSVLDERHIKVDQQAQAYAGEFEIREDLL